MRARIDISEVETRTKIRAKYLRAIENEEWDLLPGPVYVKSFLRTYGDYLGLDSRLLIDEYKRRYERPSDHEMRPIAANANYKRDFEVEQAFREVSNSITTRGNVFRVLYVGQALKNGVVQAEYLGEAFVERQAVFTQDPSNSDIIRTTDSTYRVLSNRIVTE